MDFNDFIKKLSKNKKKIIKTIILAFYIIVISPITLFGAWIVYVDLRAPPAYIYDPILQLEHWTVVEAGEIPAIQHNSFTDMIYYNNSFYLIHQQSKWHLQDTNSALIISKSPNAKNWEEIARITLPNTDVRDPKFANINGKLFVYFLPNYNFDPAPSTTYYTYSDDGFETFVAPQELKVNVTYHYANGTIDNVVIGGWNLWRPKTPDNLTWYVLASGRKLGKVAESVHDADVSNTITVLLKTTDGFNWKEDSEAFTLWGNGEACLEFLPNGEIISTFRVGSMGASDTGYALGNFLGGTMIGTTFNNFKNWSFIPNFQTRLDGATLFSLNGRIFAVARNHLGPRTDMGNHFITKRTAFYEVKSDQLIHLFDLPSNGDTSYTGVVIKDGWVYTCYYTNPINKDLPWFIGLAFLPKSDIRIARVNATGLLLYANSIGGG